MPSCSSLNRGNDLSEILLNRSTEGKLLLLGLLQHVEIGDCSIGYGTQIHPSAVLSNARHRVEARASTDKIMDAFSREIESRDT